MGLESPTQSLSALSLLLYFLLSPPLQQPWWDAHLAAPLFVSAQFPTAQLNPQAQACSFADDATGYSVTWHSNCSGYVNFVLTFRNFPTFASYWTGVGYSLLSPELAMVENLNNVAVTVTPAKLYPNTPPQKNLGSALLINPRGAFFGGSLEATWQIHESLLSGCKQWTFYTSPTRVGAPYAGQPYSKLICNVVETCSRNQCTRGFAGSLPSYDYQNYPGYGNGYPRPDTLFNSPYSSSSMMMGMPPSSFPSQQAPYWGGGGAYGGYGGMGSSFTGGVGQQQPPQFPQQQQQQQQYSPISTPIYGGLSQPALGYDPYRQSPALGALGYPNAYGGGGVAGMQPYNNFGGGLLSAQNPYAYGQASGMGQFMGQPLQQPGQQPSLLGQLGYGRLMSPSTMGYGYGGDGLQQPSWPTNFPMKKERRRRKRAVNDFGNSMKRRRQKRQYSYPSYISPLRGSAYEGQDTPFQRLNPYYSYYNYYSYPSTSRDAPSSRWQFFDPGNNYSQMYYPYRTIVGTGTDAKWPLSEAYRNHADRQYGAFTYHLPFRSYGDGTISSFLPGMLAGDGMLLRSPGTYANSG